MAERLLEHTLAHLLAALGAGVTSLTLGAGCDAMRSDTASPPVDDGADAAGGGGAAAEGSGGAGAVFPDSQEIPPDPPAGIFSVPSSPELDPPGSFDPTTCVRVDDRPDWSDIWEVVCLGMATQPSSCQSAAERIDLARGFACGFQQGASYVCGPHEAPLAPDASVLVECCYALGGGCPVGRPFLVDGAARVAAVVRADGWSAHARAPRVDDLDGRTRAALADAYAQDGATEHASIASFARFALHCLALGAPPELVLAAQQAGLDELGHARRSFALASAYAGEPLAPGPLAIDGALAAGAEPREVVMATIREGCIAETVSAILVAAARDAATDPAVRESLDVVASEELEHAALAWRFARWALGRFPEIASDVADVLARALRWVGIGAVTGRSGDPDRMREHGYLPVEERRALAESAIEQVVRQAGRALLEPYGVRADVVACSVWQ